MRRYGPGGPIRPRGPFYAVRIGSPASRDRVAEARHGREYTHGSRRGGRGAVGPFLRAQVSGRREKTSLSSRSPLETLALVSSLTISAAELSSSIAPGGATLPLASLSHSKPCTGASCWRFGARVGGDARRVRVARGCRGAALRGRARVVAGAVVPAPLRWAMRRALGRCGRVRGRFASTPWSLPAAAPSLEL
jgi:hypothetical protein